MEQSSDAMQHLVTRPCQWIKGIIRVSYLRRPQWNATSGTVHAYCGTTLDACISDLLPWDKKPTKEDMQLAYCSKTRIRRAEDWLVLRPYSPCLFRLGALTGPTLLTDIMAQQLSTLTVKQRWKEEMQKKVLETQTGGKWIESMRLPCRKCSDRDGPDAAWKPLNLFRYNMSEDICFFVTHDHKL